MPKVGEILKTDCEQHARFRQIHLIVVVILYIGKNLAKVQANMYNSCNAVHIQEKIKPSIRYSVCGLRIKKSIVLYLILTLN